MSNSLLMPKLGLTMTEGLLLEWLIPEGAAFKAGDSLFVVETDKVANEIPAESDGVLSQVVVSAGQTVAVGEVIAHLNGAQLSTPSDVQKAAPVAVEAGAIGSNAAAMDSAPMVTLPMNNNMVTGRIFSTPLARRLAQTHQVDLQAVSGTGPKGRVKAVDVMTHATSSKGTGDTASVTSSKDAPVISANGGVRSKPSSINLAMARRLTEVKQMVPHFYLAVDANVSRLIALRKTLNDAQPDIKLTFNHFIVAAVGKALKEMPDANRIWQDDEIITFHSADVGVAVNTERGLFVPVVRNAGELKLLHLAKQIQDKVGAARSSSLTLKDTGGGAITVSNAGMYNVKFMTPIINPGQAMILGVGSINPVFRPAKDGSPELQQEMGLVLAADHRIMDGVSGLAFLNKVVGYLENPVGLLI